MSEVSAKTYPVKSISNWLFFTAGFVFVMVVIGAITRLTESGLSIVEWKPLIGALPPLSDAEWNKVFDLYKQSPQFQKENFWMELADFKKIFFWEWFHRLWGRAIGLVFALPYLYFLIRGQVPSKFKWPLFGLFILGGMQGAMGWYMVMSGLVDRPSVSHYRLAAHLVLAFIILCSLIWTGLRIRDVERQGDKVLFIHGLVAFCVLGITIFWGAFVAGLDAGLIYNEFPFMGKGLVPSDMWHENPAWMNIFQNPAAVQFVHRWLGIGTAIAVLSLVGHAMKRERTDWCFVAVGMMALFQVGLGIATLLSGVHIHIAATHQAGAMTLLILLLVCLYKTKSPAQS